MSARINRREFLRLAGLGGMVFASGLGYSAGTGHEELEGTIVVTE